MTKHAAPIPATLLCDFYKVSHREQYPPGTEYVYSTWTPRASRIDGIDKVVAFGLQAFIKRYLIEYFNTHFFERTLSSVLHEYTRVIKNTLGIDDPPTDHIRDLWELGYLPIRIKAVKEGTRVPLRVPMFTIENTRPEQFWLVNYLETVMSSEIWQPSTSATLAYEYRQILDRYALETTGTTEGVEFQAHDFSMRGMEGVEAAERSGMGHLLSFVGTDTIPAILGAERWYKADITKELIGTSIPASEHSVMCAGGANDEFETYRRLIEDVYPNGLVSLVSDTWDLWHVLTDTLPKLKDSIMARDGKVVIRPDSGDPVDIICGKLISSAYAANRGVIELLWETFGGTVNEQGYKVLDPHIGAIYGDSINLERCEAICARLKAKGFASSNIVFGVGSYTYQYQTRDTFSFALKATWVQVNGVGRNIFKDPVTDDGTKKSLTGKVLVRETDHGAHGGVEQNIIYVRDKMDDKELETFKSVDLLEPVFEDGKLLREESFAEVRAQLGAIHA